MQSGIASLKTLVLHGIGSKLNATVRNGSTACLSEILNSHGKPCADASREARNSKGLLTNRRCRASNHEHCSLGAASKKSELTTENFSLKI